MKMVFMYMRVVCACLCTPASCAPQPPVARLPAHAPRGAGARPPSPAASPRR